MIYSFIDNTFENLVNKYSPILTKKGKQMLNKLLTIKQSESIAEKLTFSINNIRYR